MEFLRFVALQQAVVWVAFSSVAVAGAFAQRQWGPRACAAVVVLAWPVLMLTALWNELRVAPQLLELNSLAVVFRNLWGLPTLGTVALAVSLWLMRRTLSRRRLVLQSVGAGAMWAFVMPVPIMLISLGLATVIPKGTAEYYYVDFRPMGLEVLETGTPTFSHYTGGAIPLRYRAELDGREVEVRIVPAEGLTAQFQVRAVTPNSPPFEIDAPILDGCKVSYVRERDNVLDVAWSTVPSARGLCYGDRAPDVQVSVRFVGSSATLKLHGPLIKGGEYYIYDSL